MAHDSRSGPTPEGQTADTVAVGPARESKSFRIVRHKAPCMAFSARGSRFVAQGIPCATLDPAFRALLRGKENRVKRATRVGSVTFNRRFGKWVYLWWENGKRRSRTIGTVKDFPTREAAWQAAR